MKSIILSHLDELHKSYNASAFNVSNAKNYDTPQNISVYVDDDNSHGELGRGLISTGDIDSDWGTGNNRVHGLRMVRSGTMGPQASHEHLFFYATSGLEAEIMAISELNRIQHIPFQFMQKNLKVPTQTKTLDYLHMMGKATIHTRLPLKS